ncbi:MAG TPA: hypothetical protein VJ385_04650 [Fibrobacteria bacterium]|nr:hypothetical protein [Fibrobacteria bacterium]
MRAALELDDLILGDNQFFGINHMSQEKARQLAGRFNDMRKIYRAYHTAYDMGIRAVMLNANEKAGLICDYFRDHRSEFKDLALYPSIPYPHKYANLVAEKGILGAIQEVVSGQSAWNLLGMAGKSVSALSGDMTKVMEMLIDVEMRIFRKLDFKVVYLQNIITDLLLGLKFKDIFTAYCQYIEKKYAAVPGFLTMNVPRLAAFLQECGIENATICGNFNKIGYLMSPGPAEYEAYFRRPKYPMTAMSVYASGAIPPAEAIEYVKGQGLKSIVFGASTRDHMAETLKLVRG